MFFMSVVLDPGHNVSHLGHLSGAAMGWLYLRSTGDVGTPFSLAGIKHRLAALADAPKAQGGAVRRMGVEAARAGSPLPLNHD